VQRGRDVDDDSPTRGLERLERRVAHVEHADAVDLEHRAEALGLESLGGREEVARRAIDQRVERAVRAHRVVDGRATILLLAHVADNVRGLDVLGLERLDRLREERLASPHDRHRAAMQPERASDLEPDAAAAAGDECHAASETICSEW